MSISEYAAKKNIPKDKKILDTVKQLGGKNIKNKNVTFVFDEKGTGSILLHARSAELQAAALAAPYVAKYGDLIAGQKNHESTGLATLTFAAPVIINGDTVNVGVSVQFQSNGKPKAVNVELQSGGKFVFDAKKVPAGLDSRVKRYVQGTSLPTTGTNKGIPQTAPKVKHSDGNSSDTSDKNPTKRESKEIEDAYEPTLDDLTTKRGLEGLKKNHRQIYDAFRDFIREKTYIRPFDTKTYTEAVKSVAKRYKVTDADIMWLEEELKNATEVYINKPSDIQPSYAELVKEFDTILSDITERAAKPADGNKWAQGVKGKTVKLTADEYAVNKAESVRYLSLALTSKKIP